MNVSALEIRIPSFASFVYSMFWKLSLNDVTKVTHFSPRIVTALLATVLHHLRCLTGTFGPFSNRWKVQQGSFNRKTENPARFYFSAGDAVNKREH